MDVPPPAEWRYHWIPEGTAGTRATVEEMGRLAVACSTHERLIQLAQAIVRDVPSHDQVGELVALYDWISPTQGGNLRYVPDPRGLEHVSGPCHALFVSGQEDCDGHATCLAALALALNYGVAFRTVGTDETRPDEFSHVYALLGRRTPAGEEWYAADTTMPGATLGWEPDLAQAYLVKDWVLARP